MLAPSGKDLLSILPQLIVGCLGMLVLLVDSIRPKTSKRILAALSVLGLIGAGVAAVMVVPKGPGPVAATMQGAIMSDGYTAFFSVVFVLGTALSILLSSNYLERLGINFGEYYALLLFTTLGAMVMASSVNLICIFIGLEVLSISLYILAGYRNERRESDESAMKYFLLGAFASAFLLYGIALVFGSTGSINITDIQQAINAGQGQLATPGSNFMLLAGLAMMLVGFGFKVAVVPFHVWTPDVYEGAPTCVTAFMSVGAKAAGFAALLRVLASGFQDQGLQVQISAVLASIAALTMLVGNVVAIVQPSIKRMLAYSSIAHAGYMLVGIVAAVRPTGGFGGSEVQAASVAAVLFYALSYTVSNLGAFGVLLALEKEGEEVTQISDLAGVGARYPWLGALMTLFLLSLAGLPPTAGFFGKLFLLYPLGDVIERNPQLLWLILVFVLTSVVSFFYYLGVVRSMYFDKPAEDETPATFVGDWQLRGALILSAVLVIALGVGGGGVMGFAQQVAQSFMGGSPFAMMR